MIDQLRRVFARTPDPVPPQAFTPEISVIDGSGTGLGDDFVARLPGHGLPARLTAPADLSLATSASVLLLPARIPILPSAAAHLVSIIDTLAADRTSGSRARIVLAWWVRHTDRARLAIPAASTRNWSPLLLGTTWAHELVHHRDDRSAATLCLSAQISTLMHAHRSVAGVSILAICRALRTLDPHFLHALAVTVPHSPSPCLDLSPLVATVHTRLAQGRAEVVSP